jgi:PEP-CTERM motif
MRIHAVPTIGLLLSTLSLPTTAVATTISIVTLDTTALASLPGASTGPFSLFFQLTDGSGVGDGSSAIILSDFAFGGGSFAPDTTAFGGASGNVGAGVFLTDSTFFASLGQGFTPGTTLSFRVETTGEPIAGGTPDTLAFSILDVSGFPIATEDPTFADTLFTVYLDSSSPLFLRYATDLTRTPIVMSAADISTETTSVPEPGTLTLVGLASTVVGLTRWRRRRFRAT